MKLHSCKVRLHANVNDEVRKIGVTSAEIRVLQRIHGEDAVLEVVKTGDVKRTEGEERARLDSIYGEKIITSIFGQPVESIAAVEGPASIKDDSDEATEQQGVEALLG